jgi:hypothetical protein
MLLMTQQERQGWKIVASLFLILFLVSGGGINTRAVFFPLLKYFGWSRAYLFDSRQHQRHRRRAGRAAGGTASRAVRS